MSDLKSNKLPDETPYGEQKSTEDFAKVDLSKLSEILFESRYKRKFLVEKKKISAYCEKYGKDEEEKIKEEINRELLKSLEDSNQKINYIDFKQKYQNYISPNDKILYLITKIPCNKKLFSFVAPPLSGKSFFSIQILEMIRNISEVEPHLDSKLQNKFKDSYKNALLLKLDLREFMKPTYYKLAQMNVHKKYKSKTEIYKYLKLKMDKVICRTIKNELGIENDEQTDLMTRYEKSSTYLECLLSLESLIRHRKLSPRDIKPRSDCSKPGVKFFFTYNINCTCFEKLLVLIDEFDTLKNLTNSLWSEEIIKPGKLSQTLKELEFQKEAYIEDITGKKLFEEFFTQINGKPNNFKLEIITFSIFPMFPYTFTQERNRQKYLYTNAYSSFYPFTGMGYKAIKSMYIKNNPKLTSLHKINSNENPMLSLLNETAEKNPIIKEDIEGIIKELKAIFKLQAVCLKRGLENKEQDLLEKYNQSLRDMFIAFFFKFYSQYLSFNLGNIKAIKETKNDTKKMEKEDKMAIWGCNFRCWDMLNYFVKEEENLKTGAKKNTLKYFKPYTTYELHLQSISSDSILTLGIVLFYDEFKDNYFPAPTQEILREQIPKTNNPSALVNYATYHLYRLGVLGIVPFESVKNSDHNTFLKENKPD